MFTSPTLERPTIPFVGKRSRLTLPDEWDDWFMAVSPALKPFAPHHRAVGQWLESIEPGTRPTPGIDIWPRGGGKSTFVEHGTAYLAERRKRRFALYVSGTQDSASRHVGSVQTLLESLPGPISRRLENEYGYSKGWARNLIRTASGFNIIALGLDTAMRGIKLDALRPDLIVLDDIDDRHDTERVLRKKIEILTDTILPAGSDDVMVWGVQNLVHANSIFSQLADGRADFLADRQVRGPVPAVKGIETELRHIEALGRKVQVVTGGEPTWQAKGIKECQAEITAQGWSSFDREQQHNVENTEGALLTQETFNEHRVEHAPSLARSVVAVDPAATSKASSDETGIGAAGMESDGHFYVLRDESGHYTPKQWGRRSVLLHDEVGADCVVIEQNQGGEMAEQVVRTAAEQLHEEGLRDSPNIVVKRVHASKGKRARAEPIAQRYEEGVVHHVGDLHRLETQWTTWAALDGDPSPDRVDWDVWALTELGAANPHTEPATYASA